MSDTDTFRAEQSYPRESSPCVRRSAPVIGIERTNEARQPHPLFVRSQCSPRSSRSMGRQHRTASNQAKPAMLPADAFVRSLALPAATAEAVPRRWWARVSSSEARRVAGTGRRVIEAHRIVTTPCLATAQHQLRHRTQQSISKAQRRQGLAHGVDGSVNHVPRRRPRYAGRPRLPPPCCCHCLAFPCLDLCPATAPALCQPLLLAACSCASHSDFVSPSEACERTKPLPFQANLYPARSGSPTPCVRTNKAFANGRWRQRAMRANEQSGRIVGRLCSFSQVRSFQHVSQKPIPNNSAAKSLGGTPAPPNVPLPLLVCFVQRTRASDPAGVLGSAPLGSRPSASSAGQHHPRVRVTWCSRGEMTTRLLRWKLGRWSGTLSAGTPSGS